jgi:hypothetical protein
MADVSYELIQRNNLTADDIAWLVPHQANKRIIDRPLSFGAGISFETKAGIFNLTYALGKQLNNPIILRAAKIHFGIVSLF